MEVLRVAAPIQIIYSHQYNAFTAKSASNSDIRLLKLSYSISSRDLRLISIREKLAKRLQVQGELCYCL